jgi:HEAT repeat protein
MGCTRALRESTLDAPPSYLARIVECIEAEPDRLLGSGILVTPHWLLTAWHVCKGKRPGRDLCAMAGGIRYRIRSEEPKVDERLDLALLPVKRTTEPASDAWATFLDLDPSDYRPMRSAGGSLGLTAMGFPASQDGFASFPDLHIHLADAALRDIQIQGGIPEGCSGGALTLEGDDGRHLIAGLLVLGGQRGATSRAIGVAAILPFLRASLPSQCLDRLRLVNAWDLLDPGFREVRKRLRSECRQLRGLNAKFKLHAAELYQEPGIEVAPLSVTHGTPTRTRVAQIDDLFLRFSELAEAPRGSTPRFVVLGPPGSGKSSLLAWLALRCVATSQDGLRPLPLSRPPIPARVRLNEWLSEGEGLELHLESKYGARHPGGRISPSASDWGLRLRAGEVLLLLDGLDEVAPSRGDWIHRFAQTLADYPACPALVCCRDQVVPAYDGWFPVGEFLSLRLDGLTRSQQLDYVGRHPGVPDRNLLTGQIGSQPTIEVLLSNPLLLMVVCGASPGDGGLMTGAGVIGAVVSKLLAGALAQDATKQHPPLDPELLGEAVADAALRLLFLGNRQGGWSAQAVAEALAHAPAASPDTQAGTTQPVPPQGIVDALVARRVLFESVRNDAGEPSGSRVYSFLHRNVQEYLAGSAIARRIGREGLGARMALGGIARPLHEWVDRLSWDAGGHEVLVYAIAQLDAPWEIIRCLADERLDDYLRHRLALAAQALAELPPALRARPEFAELKDRVATDVLALWRRSSGLASYSSITHLDLAMQALARIDPNLVDPLLTDAHGGDACAKKAYLRAILTVEPVSTGAAMRHLGPHLTDESREVRRLAARAIGALGHSALAPGLEASLADALAHPSAWQDAVVAVDLLGPAALRPAILGPLCDLLWCESLCRTRAGRGWIGPPPPADLRPESILSWMTEMGERDPSPPAVWRVLFDAVCRSRELAPVLAAHFDALLAAGHWVRARVMAEGREIDPLADTTPDRLAQGLASVPDADKRQILRILPHLPAPAWTAPVLDALAGLIARSDPETCTAALLCTGACPLEVPDALWAQMLAWAEEPSGTLSGSGDPSRAAPQVRTAARTAVRRLGGAGLKAERIEALAQLLTDPDPRRQIAALDLLKSAGERAATPQVLDTLHSLLRHPSWELRRAAADLVGDLGASGADPDLIAGLAEAIRDSSADRTGPVLAVPGAALDGAQGLFSPQKVGEFARIAALQALQRIGPHLRNLDTVQGLPEILADALARGDYESRMMAGRAIQRLGPAAHTKAMNGTIVALCRSQDSDDIKIASALFQDLRDWPTTPELLDALAESLASDCIEQRRCAAARTVARLGPPAATPRILSGLLAALECPEQPVRRAAAWAIDRLGEKVLTPAMVIALIRHVGDGGHTLDSMLVSRHLLLGGGTWNRVDPDC